MTVEASDLNDGNILQATRQEAGTNDQLRFKIKLPSGREVISEWIPRDKAKQAIFLWLERIKQEVVADAEAKREEARARRRALPEPAAQPSASAPTASAGPPTLPTPRGRAVEDPVDHARNQLALAAAEVEHWTMTHKDAEQKLKTATRVRDNWSRILSQLTGDENV